ncbi:thioredoxin [Gulosibacter sp. ACHW.36C]|uniref:Thioredoxin n=1 Tax=Gulosibacter sediminis TaxID=1729695 RepID=A0ABY4N0S4_9MICO|nr:thioredoxin [Gulosibacter sediminis]UQN15644.1 thioredoxin [Gulosibacter sediminis]
MATTELTEQNFMETVTGEGIHLVDFWAAWCGPCRQFGPIYEKVSETHPDITFGKVDTEANQQLAGELGIRSIPTLMAFRDGVLMFNQAGALPAAAVEQVIEAVAAADMDEVRAEIEKQQSAAATGEPTPRTDGAQV